MSYHVGHRTGTFDWFIERRVGSPPRPAGQAIKPPAPTCRLERRQAEELVSALATSLSVRWSRTRVLEVNEREPALSSFHQAVGSRSYCSLTRRPADLGAIPSQFPDYKFYSGSLEHFADACRRQFDWVESLEPPLLVESDLAYRRRLRDFAALVDREGYLLTREFFGVGKRSWTYHQAVLAREGLYVRARQLMPDGACLIVSARS